MPRRCPHLYDPNPTEDLDFALSVLEMGINDIWEHTHLQSAIFGSGHAYWTSAQWT